MTTTSRGPLRTGDDTVPELAAALRRAGIDDVDDSGLARALYSSDASLYRVHPRAVVRPRDVDEVLATLAVCRELGVPLTARGAGTSIAGNAVGAGVVLDTSRHLDRVRSIDAEARTAVVEPGLVQAALQTAARPHGLRFGPDPSTHNRCTVGGMIGNNACGSRALGYGRTSDNVVALDVVTGAGDRLHLGPGTAPADGVLADLHRLVGAELATIRTQFGRFGRQVSGYSLEHLLPERGFDVARALVGSEGTLALVLGATVRLVADAPFRGLVVLGYPTMADAADATPGLLRHGPTAVEGLDSRIVQRLRDVPAATVPDLPRGEGCLHVRIDFPLGADTADRGRAAYRSFVEDAARLVARYGGSLSGEHGDGRARSELLPLMYSPAAIGAFAKVKALLDPDDVLNPGVLVRPARLDDDVRVAAAPRRRERLALAYPHDGGDFSAAVHRCTGVGKCRADLQSTGGGVLPAGAGAPGGKETTRGPAPG